MTKDELLTLIAAKIDGQGSQVDIGGALGDILRGVVDLIPAPAETLSFAAPLKKSGTDVSLEYGRGLEKDDTMLAVKLASGAGLKTTQNGLAVDFTKVQQAMHEMSVRIYYDEDAAKFYAELNDGEPIELSAYESEITPIPNSSFGAGQLIALLDDSYNIQSGVQWLNDYVMLSDVGTSTPKLEDYFLPDFDAEISRYTINGYTFALRASGGSLEIECAGVPEE